MDPFVHLNYDVLNVILSLLSPSDADKLARTCRAAYRYAIPRILSDVTLGLGFHRKPKSQLASFCHFVLAGAPGRALLLRRLDLRRDAFPWVEVEIKAVPGNPRGSRAYTIDYSVASLLAEVIQQADGLEEVHVAGADPLLASEPRLQDALASRRRLRCVAFEKCGSASLECISRLSGNISALALAVDDQYVLESSRCHSLSALARIAGTLESLDLEDAIFVTGELSPDVVLSAVRQLTLRGWADLSETLRVVPNLRTLRLHTCRSRPSAFPPPVDPPHIDLDELITDLHIPIRCTARRVELQFNAFLQPDALAVLERMNPVVLSCHAGWSLPARDVAQRLPSLQHLEMHVKWRISDGVPDAPPEAWLISLVSVFRTLKLVGLVLRIGPRVMADSTMPLDVLARDIAGACSDSLMFVGISSVQHIPDAHLEMIWYRCVRGDRPVRQYIGVERLSPWEGSLAHDHLCSLEH